MGESRNPSSISLDLSSTAQQSPNTTSPSATEPKSSPLRADDPAKVASPSYSLPTNLPSALRHLDNEQLDRLHVAVLAERQARGGKKPPRPKEPSRELRQTTRIEAGAITLTTSKMNAVRAAFKAGVRPLQIARQFGVSLSDVRKALANDDKK